MIAYFSKYAKHNKHLLSLRLFRVYQFTMYWIKDPSVILMPITMNRELSTTNLGEVVQEIILKFITYIYLHDRSDEFAR